MKSSAVGLAIAAVAFGASTIYLSLQLQQERAQADKLIEETRALNARIAELQNALSDRPFASLGPFAGVPGRPGGKPTGPPPSVRTDGSSNAAEAVIVNEGAREPRGEAFQKMMRAQMRANNKRLYADVGAQLRLSKDETNKLIDLISAQQVGGFAISREADNGAERRRLMEEAQRKNKAEIVDLIGAAKAESLEEYQQSIPARQELEMLSRQLEGTDSSLSDDQQKRMLAALVEERKRIPVPQFTDSGSQEEFAKAYSSWLEDYNERVASQARSILNSEQLNTYNEYRQWQQEIREQMGNRRQSRGQRVPGSNIEFSTVTATYGGDTASAPAPAPPAEKPRKSP